jgi:hypothetical protein
MKLLLRGLSLLALVGGCVGLGCGGINYYTYKEVAAPDHIIHPLVIPLVIDSQFSAEEALEIKQAAREWNTVLNGQIKIVFSEHTEMGSDHRKHLYPSTFRTFSDGQKLQAQYENSNLGWVVYHLNSDDPNLASFGEINNGTLAFVLGIDEHFIVVINDRFANRSLKDVMMHEMGHLLGADHIKVSSLEYPYYSNQQSDCIDKITAAQVAEVRKLDLATLRYCLLPGWE